MYDLVCLGGGPAGISCALRSAELGKKVCLVERTRLGGNDLHNGTMLKYLLHNAGIVYRDTREAVQYGIRAKRKYLKWNDVKFSWRSLKTSISRFEIEKEAKIQALLSARGVNVIKGSARFLSSSRIFVDRGDAGQTMLEGRNVLIATGSKYLLPHHPGIEHASIVDDIFALPSAPQSVIIIGGGYIATELACILSLFGTKVTMCFETPFIAPAYDPDISKVAMNLMQRRGITLCADAVIANIQHLNPKALKLLVVHEKYINFTAEKVVFAGGRESSTEELDLQRAGVDIGEKGQVLVDEYDKTSMENIFAIGDVASRPMLYPVARVASKLLAERLFGKGRFEKEKYKMNYKFIPSAVLVGPPMAKCGLSEAQAKETFGEKNVTSYLHDRIQVEEALLAKPLPFVMKVVCKKDEGGKEMVVGMHGIGKNMNEIITGYSVAMNKGIYKEDLERFMPIHPTSAEEFCNAVSGIY